MSTINKDNHQLDWNINNHDNGTKEAWEKIETNDKCQPYLSQIFPLCVMKIKEDELPPYIPMLQIQKAVDNNNTLDITFVWPNIKEYPPIIEGISWVKSIK